MDESRQPARGDVIRGATKKRRFAVILIAGTVWLSLVVTGMAMIIRYANVPGASGVKPVNWPADSQIALDANRFTLVMFAHPHCPCTRASLGELEQLTLEHSGIENNVLFPRVLQLEQMQMAEVI